MKACHFIVLIKEKRTWKTCLSSMEEQLPMKSSTHEMPRINSLLSKMTSILMTSSTWGLVYFTCTACPALALSSQNHARSCTKNSPTKKLSTLRHIIKSQFYSVAQCSYSTKMKLCRNNQTQLISCIFTRFAHIPAFTSMFDILVSA